MKRIYDSNYIAGTWHRSTAKDMIDVCDPNTGALAGQVGCGTEEDAYQAVSAAQQAFAAWSGTPLTEKCATINRLQERLLARQPLLADAIAAEVGTPLKIARIVQVDAPIRNIGNFIDLAAAFPWSQNLGNSLIEREPFGVVACITPWNFPLHQIVLKVVPALLAGNTVVLKPSELTPRTTRLICEAIDQAGFPPGVVNVVNGIGSIVGSALSRAEGVDMVSFTGSTEAGRAVSRLAAGTIKKVTLELGGKSPSLVLPGADLPVAIKGTLASCFLNNGQTCSALTRLIVPSHDFVSVEALLHQEMAKLTVGSSLIEGNRIGPLISAKQRERVDALITKGVEEGAVPIASGPLIPRTGFFVSPKAFRVEPANVLANEEIFGPVLCVIPYDDIAHGIRLANETVYGLAGAVWGERNQALDAARKIRSGQVDINGARFNPMAPFGGFKQSGVGREGGHVGLEEFLEHKAIQINDLGKD
jgi:acyl-CoA reductase-like NAD-dependent aldehyde dehydrogenase